MPINGSNWDSEVARGLTKLGDGVSNRTDSLWGYQQCSSPRDKTNELPGVLT